MGKLKVIVTSDLHGNLPVIISPFDLFLICGDNCPAHSHYYSFQSEWFKTDFADWINTLPFKNEWSKVVMIWGNHDYVGERLHAEDLYIFNEKTKNRVVILNNNTYDYEYLTDNGIETLKIFGTPYCKIFGNWAFMVNDGQLEYYYNEMPYNCDIVISHDSPSINGLGTINQGWNNGYDAGNKVLDEYIKQRKPKYFFSGHIHSGNHNFEDVNGTMMANVSYIDEHYKPKYLPLEFEI
jgi:Icc-related predicted phosphoesterase